MIPTLLSVFLSVIPKQYRGRYLGDHSINVQRGALISGIIQTVGCFGIIWAGYARYAHARMDAAAAAAARHGSDKIGEGFATLGAGAFAPFEYLIQPLNLVLIYFALEGMARLTAAVAGNQVMPSLPLQFLGWIHGKVSSRQADIALGPHLEDIVKPGDPPNFDLQIMSSRPKDWNTLLTISYQDKLYELDSTAEQPPPHKYVYRLRFIYPGKLVRGLHYYHPKETLEPES